MVFWVRVTHKMLNVNWEKIHSIILSVTCDGLRNFLLLIHIPLKPYMTHPTPPLHDPPPPLPCMTHPPHPSPAWHTPPHPTPTWPTHPTSTWPTPPHPCMTHPTPPHPCMTHPTPPHPTLAWPTPPQPLHDPPYPTPGTILGRNGMDFMGSFTMSPFW